MHAFMLTCSVYMYNVYLKRRRPNVVLYKPVTKCTAFLGFKTYTNYWPNVAVSVPPVELMNALHIVFSFISKTWLTKRNHLQIYICRQCCNKSGRHHTEPKYEWR